jgi:carbon-monoxide dehydrogenase small subunit
VTIHDLRFTANGTDYLRRVPSHRLLIELLRDDLGLTGTKEGCSIGVCGACSVLVDGELLSACLLPALFVDGRSVTTIEGIAGPNGSLSPLQEAFIRHGGLQCGICTPGQIVAATALLMEVPKPTEPDLRSWMKGNLCRCTGYYKIIESILAAAGVEGSATSVEEAVS